jgi:hypothetical protein
MKQDVFYHSLTPLPKFIIKTPTLQRAFSPSTDKVRVAPVVKKFPVFYRTTREISMFRGSLHSFLTKL